MKKIIATLAMIVPICSLHAQNDVYGRIPIRLDTAVQWIGDSYKIVDLTPQSSENSLKKLYLGKIKNGTVNAYMLNSNNTLSSYDLAKPGLGVQDWLKGLAVELPTNTSLKEWYFVDKNLAADNYDRFKYRIGASRLSSDSCCGCDEAEAFAVKQLLHYKNGKFNIHNIFMSPLCARKTATNPHEWYPLCHVAYNDKAGKNFVRNEKDAVFIKTEVVNYDFSREYDSPFDSVITINKTDIGSLIYQDILKGILKPVFHETGIPIPVHSLLTMGMPSDTVAVYDDDFEKVVEYKVVQHQISSSDLSMLRITQDFYFDFKKEKLYSVVRSVVLMRRHLSFDGTVRGYSNFCRLE